MCGILGIVSVNRDIDHRACERALTLIAHRGPDGQGLWRRPDEAAPFVSLGHRRLAIIDLTEAAAQPMASADLMLRLTYNGEIYNYVEVRRELEGKGHQFRSSGDTEVILAAYAEWGEACLERLNGMFAFAVWDERRRELFAARDRFGEKPFHYAFDERGGTFAFASEAKALLAMPFVDPALDDRALYRFVKFSELAGAEQTLWRGVKRLLHAHTLRVSYGGERLRLTTRRYWDIDLSRTATADLDDAARQVAALFEDSVRLRLRSDVAVGTSLSGGVDSSAIVCQIHALGAASGQTSFSARMEDATLDEGQHIDAVIAKTGVGNRQVWPSTSELTNLFAMLCYHQEEPFPATSQLAQFVVMRLARDAGVTVLLDGQGADELFAGYTPYFLARYTDLADRWRLGALRRERRAFGAHPARAFPLSRRALAARMFPNAYAGFVRLRGQRTAVSAPDSADATPWWRREWMDAFRRERRQEPPLSSRDQLTMRLYGDALQGELQELLRFADRSSMAWSREVRQPFLDHRLAELAFALPPEHKIAGGESKVVLRRAVRGVVPDSILGRRDKLGFQAPLARWLRDPLCTWTEHGLEVAASELGDRMVPDAVGMFRRVKATLQERQAWPVFSLLTLGECRRQLGTHQRPVSVVSRASPCG